MMAGLICEPRKQGRGRAANTGGCDEDVGAADRLRAGRQAYGPKPDGEIAGKGDARHHLPPTVDSAGRHTSPSGPLGATT
jgi:hypothetical protein